MAIDIKNRIHAHQVLFENNDARVSNILTVTTASDSTVVPETFGPFNQALDMPDFLAVESKKNIDNKDFFFSSRLTAVGEDFAPYMDFNRIKNNAEVILYGLNIEKAFCTIRFRVPFIGQSCTISVSRKDTVLTCYKDGQLVDTMNIDPEVFIEDITCTLDLGIPDGHITISDIVLVIGDDVTSQNSFAFDPTKSITF